MDKNYEFFLEINKIQERAIKIESQMNELFNERRKIESQRLVLGKTKSGLDRKWRDMIIEHNKIDYIKVKNAS